MYILKMYSEKVFKKKGGDGGGVGRRTIGQFFFF